MKRTEQTMPMFLLTLFDEGGGDGGNVGDAPPQAGDGQVVNNNTGGNTPTDTLDAEWNEAKKGKFKELYGRDVKKAVDQRFRSNASMEAELESARRVMKRVAEITGEDDANDPEAIMQYLDELDPHLEEEAIEKGIPKETLREMKRQDREIRELQRQREEAARQQLAQEQTNKWLQEAEAVAEMYGTDFDLDYEMNNEETGDTFSALLKEVGVQRAFEAVHLPEILGGAMEYTMQTTKSNIAKTMQARGTRPQENGSKANIPVTQSVDFSKISDEESKYLWNEIRAGRATLADAQKVLANYSNKK